MRHVIYTTKLFQRRWRVKREKKEEIPELLIITELHIDQMYNKCIMYKCMGNSPIYMKNVKSGLYF